MAVPEHSQDPWTRVRTLHDLPADEVISALQKEIRRGNTENACFVAYEMMLTSAELEAFMWQRLQVISVEDIGFGDVSAPILVNTLFTMHQRFSREHGDRFLFGLHAVRFLCQCQKERGSDELKNWLHAMMIQKGRLPQIPDYALDMHTKRGQGMGRDIHHFLNEASKVAPEVHDRDTTYRERWLEIVKNNQD